MEVTICVPNGTDIRHLESEYPDIWEDEGWDDHQRYFVGKSSEEDDEDDPDGPISESFLPRDQAVELCGFVEGSTEGSNCLLEGNAGWAQGMISRRDFSRLAISAKEKREYKRVSKIYWAAFKRGAAVKPSLSNAEISHPRNEG